MRAILSPPAEAQGIARELPAWRLTTTLKRWWVAYMTWRVEQFAITRLSAMSDRELASMGLARQHIEHAVRGGLAAS